MRSSSSGQPPWWEGFLSIFFHFSLQVHKIDSESPFYSMSARDFLKKRYEIVVLLEGVIEQTGNSIQVTFLQVQQHQSPRDSPQARSSYLPNEVLWGYRFVNLLNFKHSESEYKIDYSAFNSVYRWQTFSELKVNTCLRIEMSTKSQETKDRCEEQNEELKGLKVGLRGEEEMLGGSKEMLCASRSLRGSTSGESQLLQIPEASPCRWEIRACLCFCILRNFSSPGEEQLRWGTTQGHRVVLRSFTLFDPGTLGQPGEPWENLTGPRKPWKPWKQRQNHDENTWDTV